MGSGCLGTLTSLSLRVFAFQMGMLSSPHLSEMGARLVIMWWKPWAQYVIARLQMKSEGVRFPLLLQQDATNLATEKET